MKTGRYSILELFDFQNLEQFVIPEIQRDYVWTKTEVIDVLKAIKDGFESVDIPYLGFIYAYNDKDYVYKYFLIDGQQRITTIFLLLIALYNKLEIDLPEHLIKNEKLKVDYKVRQATHDFLFDFVHFLNSNKGVNPNCQTIHEQNWFHTKYMNDITITNIIENFIEINYWLENIEADKLPVFLKFVEEDIQLSYFDIATGRQGEDLYIYMNSRGRHLVENETLKAEFLSKLKTVREKEDWGIEWDKWQDFFWINRLNNPDSDNSFNEFLRVVQIISMNNEKNAADKIYHFIDTNNSVDFELLPELSIIKKYFYAYKYLVENKTIADFYNKYESHNYLIKINRKQRDYFRIIPMIVFTSLIKHKDEQEMFRFNRFLYNLSRKDKISKDIRTQLVAVIKLMEVYAKNNADKYDICDLVNYSKNRTMLIDEEEVIKLNLLKKPLKETNRKDLENLFWEIEDHHIFSGEISFLLGDYFNKENLEFNYQGFKQSWLTFKELFNKKSNNKYMAKALVFYGNTWERETPYYYNNYNCQDWYWLVREDKSKYLMQLIKDMHNKDFNYIKTLIESKIKGYFKKNNYNSIARIKQVSGFLKQFKILVALDFHYNDKIYDKGSYIAEDNRYLWEGDPEFFEEKRVIYNISRYVFSGHDGRILSFMKKILMDEERIKEILKKINK